MRISLSRLYQVQKRVLRAVQEAAAQAESIRGIRVRNLTGTQSETDALRQRLEEAENAYQRYSDLSGLYADLRQIGARAALPATQLQARLEVTNQRIAFLERVLSENRIPVAMRDIPEYLRSKTEDKGRGLFSDAPEILVAPDTCLDINLKEDLAGYRKEAVRLQDEIAKANLSKVTLQHSKLLDEFIG